jgi:endonuclease YncB( thermonuclease family)
MRRLPALLAVLLFVVPVWGADYSARVVGIADGDTITVLTAEKKQVKIRLNGIDAPETGQPFGTRAKQLASELAFGKTVTIQERDKDRYGRTVADVILPDGRSMNHEMVGQGLAWWYRQYAPNDRELSRLESEAKTAQRGLWSQPNPVPPWDWRKGVGVPQTAAVVGNRKSHVFHKPSCKGVSAMKEANKVEFETAEAAEKAGYRKAGDCWK